MAGGWVNTVVTIQGGGVVATTARVGSAELHLERSSFVGRSHEVRGVERLLASSRLVTLTGPAGVGKTRLALRVAADKHRSFPAGSWFVDLTELARPGPFAGVVEDPDVLAALVAAAIGVPEQSGAPRLRLLVSHLARRRVLLVLDNCEHVIQASAVLAGTLLSSCPRLRILATSREVLEVAGEAVFTVPPLPSPEPGRRRPLADLAGYASVALFVDRAAATAPGFTLTAENQRAVAEVCHRLDGLPLAIELAAVRTSVLSPQQILDRLADRFAVLTRATAAAPRRQDTLRACIDWSFELCTTSERLLWARLSVFVGGFELDAVEGVCADDELPEWELLDLVNALVNKSILVTDLQGPVARYRMLETIREYGQQRLVEAGEQASLCRRHADWYQRLVARARAEWISDPRGLWLARLRREHPNLRTAIECGLADSGEVEAAIRIAVSFPRHYWYAGGLSEARRWLDQALAQATTPSALRAEALLLASYLASAQGDINAAARLLDQAEDTARRVDATAQLGHAVFIRGFGAMFAGDLPAALETLEQARTILSTAPDLDVDLHLNLLLALAMTAGFAGDLKRGIASHQEAMAIIGPNGGGIHLSVALWVGGLIAWLEGDLYQGAGRTADSLRLKQPWASDDLYGVGLCLETLAWIMAGQQQHHRAAVLLGAADAVWTELRTPVTSMGHLIGYRRECERQTGVALGDTAFINAVRHGRALSQDEALAYALDEPGT
jgi:predicted ATPase